MSGKVYTFKAHTLKARAGLLRTQRNVLVAYLKMKVHAADWHAVSDAANDLREVEAELRSLRAMKTA